MKKMLFVTTIALSISNNVPVRAESVTDWAKENVDLICGAGVLVGLMVGINYVMPKLIDAHVEQKLSQAREGMKGVLGLNADQHRMYTDVQSADIVSKLAADKKELENKWKTHWSFGLIVTGSASFGNTLFGSFSIANAIVFFHLLTTGPGILKRSIVLCSTELNGNIIVESSQLNNEVIVNSPTFASFNHCLLGKIKVEKAVVELADSLVEGDIVFEHNDGTVILDKNSIITGSIVKGKALYV